MSRFFYFTAIMIFPMILFPLWIGGCADPVITKWENGVIPYYFSGSFSDSEAAVVAKAMLRWESVCAVTFDKVEPTYYAYQIIKTGNSTEWSSTIGENNSQYFMYFGSGSSEEQYGHCLHELGHCLGLLHEHQRPDRDQYVTIYYKNIWPEYVFNYETENNELIRESDYAYDYGSIMHYPEYGFSYNGFPTMKAKDPSVSIGQRKELSDIDILKVQYIYGKPGESK
jgi:hypothetical protein